MEVTVNALLAKEGEEDEEINELFKMGKKKKKNEKSPTEIALLVENVMAELEVTAEEDAELNSQGKPAINKLKKLPLLTEVLAKKQLQQEFLDHGVLTLLKNWLEPLPVGGVNRLVTPDNLARPLYRLIALRTNSTIQHLDHKSLYAKLDYQGVCYSVYLTMDVYFCYPFSCGM